MISGSRRATHGPGTCPGSLLPGRHASRAARRALDPWSSPGSTSRPREFSTTLAGVMCATLAAATLAPARSATAEIIVLKDGKRVNCRILAMDDVNITVRTAGGGERTLPKGEIASIDPSVSPVEIYEAAAEAAGAEGGALAYYVGLWSVEVDSDRKADAQVAFRVAARDPDWAGRAYHQLALLAQTPGEKKELLVRAALADPSLTAAVEALLESREEQGEIPRDALVALSEAIYMIAQGNASAAASKLAQLDALPDRAAVEMLSRRLERSTGHTIASLLSIAKGGAGKDSRAEPAPPKGPCEVCGGVGYVTCHVCQGKGYVQCSACKGEGVIRTRTYSSHGGTKTTSQTCQSCKGTGVKDCAVCLRRPGGAITESHTISVPEPCTACNGTGKVTTSVATRSTTALGTGTVTTQERPCTACQGTGSILRQVTVSLSVSASGIRRCAKCNEDGHIPLPSALRREGAESGTPPTPAARTSSLSDESIAQLVEFANLAKLAAEGRADLRWRSGMKVPLYQSLAPAVEDASDPMVFACGKWMPQSRAKVAISRAKTLQHKPRPVDLAPFEEWLTERELDYLRKNSAPVGLGQDPGGECLALVAIYERNQEVGAAPPLDRMRVFKTTFFPAPRTEAQEEICRWRFAAASANEIAFVMLGRTATWPALEIRLVRSPGQGVDLAQVASAVASDARLQSSPITLYYRVRNCVRTGELREDGADVRIALGVCVFAAVSGPEDRPLRVWTQAGSRLPRLER